MFEALEEKVAKLQRVVPGVEALLNDLSEKLKEAAAAPDAEEVRQKVSVIAEQIDAEASKLAQAVESNTPAEPTPEEPNVA